jgi:RNA polymerase sigma factor (sigma-70 family)
MNGGIQMSEQFSKNSRMALEREISGNDDSVMPEPIVNAIERSRASMAAQRRKDRRYRDERAFIDGDTECLTRDLCAQNTVADAVDALETSKAIKQAISSLSETQQRRIRLYYYDGYNQHEIAEIEGVSRQAITHSLKKSLRVLWKILKKGCFFASNCPSK